MYKIFNRKTGLYSSGGSGYRLRWTKKGKIWAERGHISNHLAMLRDPAKTYADCDIVEFDMVPVNTISIDNWCDKVKERRDNRNKARARRLEKFQKEQRRRQFEQLNKEFGS